jgi:hypothetical protein
MTLSVLYVRCEQTCDEVVLVWVWWGEERVEVDEIGRYVGLSVSHEVYNVTSGHYFTWLVTTKS